MSRLLAYLAVTCHLDFRQNDKGLLHATAVTRRWNGYQNKKADSEEDPNAQKVKKNGDFNRTTQILIELL